MKRARGLVGVFLLLALWPVGIPRTALSAAERRMAIPPLLCLRPEAYPLFGRELKWADRKDNRIGYAAAAILQEKLEPVSALAILDIMWTEQDRDLDLSSPKWRQARVDLLGRGSYAVHRDKMVLEFAVTDTATRRVVYRARAEGPLKAWPDLARQLGGAAAAALEKPVVARTVPAVPTEPPKVAPVELKVPPRPPPPPKRRIVRAVPPPAPRKPVAVAKAERKVREEAATLPAKRRVVRAVPPPAPRKPIAVAKPERKVREEAEALPVSRHAKTYYDRGVAFAEKGDYAQAIRYFSKAIELKSAYVSAYSHRGNAYGQNGDYARAISDFNKVIQFRPYHPDAYADRAVAYYYQKAYDRAWADVQTCRRLGGEVNPALLEALKQATGRSE